MAHIFVVDDDPFVQYTLSKILQRVGHRVDCFANGRLALEALQRELPDLVITDMVMPEMGGLELLEQFRAFNSQTPVLVVSAGSTNLAIDFKETAAQQGASGVLLKPFDRATFLACVETLLPQRDAASQRSSTV